MGDVTTGRGFTHESTHNETAEWYTPPEIFDAMKDADGHVFQFDLDPCSPGPGLTYVRADFVYTKAEDGLTAPWRGCVFANPPYGQETPKWVDRFVAHGNGVALLFARTDTKWFRTLAQTPGTVFCFLSQRVRFMRHDGTRGGSPGSGSMLVGIGDGFSPVFNCGLGPVMESRESVSRVDLIPVALGGTRAQPLV